MEHWQVRLLGGFGVRRGQIDLSPRFETDSARALFAWLCLHPGRPIPRDALAALLWPDKPQPAALSALRTALARVRRALDDAGDILQADAHVVTLSLPANWDVDALRIERAVAFVRSHPHRHAAGCPRCLAHLHVIASYGYDGELLAGLTVESDVFLDWLTRQREHFHRAALDALDTLAERAMLEGDWAAVARHSERQLGLEAWHEPAHRRKMQALAQQGQRAAALAQYQACAQVLQREFGIQPDPATQQVADAIRAGGWPLSARLPTPAQNRAGSLDQLPFIGRDHELAALIDLLNRPDARLVSVVGEGGIGKTRLVIRAAQDMRFAFTDGARFIFLHPEDRPTDAPETARVRAASYLAWHIADACQITLSDRRPPEAEVVAALKSRHYLLVFDSFEHVLEAAAFLSELLEAAPGCAALVASRQRLNLRCEQAFRLSGLSLEVEGVTGSAGAQMFIALAERNGIHLDEPEARAQVEDICETLHGLPLGIELAAACLSGMRLSALRQAVQHNLDAIAIPIPDLPARHRSLNAVFESAWEALDALGRRALAALSALRAPCPLQAALHLAGSPSALDSLIEQSLAHQLSDGSLWMHESTRRFAADKARAEGPAAEDAVYRRHAEWFLRWLAESRAALRGPESVQIREQLIASFDDLDAAWVWALAHGAWAWLSEAVFAYELLHRLAGRLADGVDRFAHALESVPQPSDDTTRRLRARLLIAHDGLQSLRTNQPKTEANLREAVALAGQIGDPALSVLAHSRLVRELRSGRNQQAEEMLERADAAIRQLDAQSPEAEALDAQIEYWRQRGALDFRRGRWDQAEQHMRIALSLARRAQDYALMAKTMEHLSTAIAARGPSEEADALLDQALEIYQRLQLTYQQTNVLDLLGQRADARGDYALAQRHYLRAIALAQASGNRDAEMVTRINLGISCDQMGDYAQALAHTQAALALCHEFGAADHLATVLANLSLHAHHNGKHDMALRYAREATEKARSIQTPEIEAYGWDFQGHAQLALGDIAAAETAYRRALDIRQSLDQAVLALETRAGLARAAMARGDATGAAAWVEPIAARLLRGGDLDGAEEALRVYWTTHQALARNGDPRAAAILALAVALLQQRAARLSDEASRAAYLNVDAHQRILQAAHAEAVATAGN